MSASVRSMAARLKQVLPAIAALFPEDTRIDRSRPIGVQLYALLRRAIVTCRLNPGDAIAEAAVTERLDVSRTPLREAFRQLAADGLVEVRPQSGTFVSPVNRRGWEEGRVIRAALEAAGIRLAAAAIAPAALDELGHLLDRQRRAAHRGWNEEFHELDDRFHAAISVASGLPRLWRVIDGAKAQLDRTRYLALPVLGRASATVDEHQAIFDALAARDPGRSAAQLDRHLKRSDEAMALLFETDALGASRDRAPP